MKNKLAIVGPFLLLMLGLITMQSCTKTEFLDYEKQPLNKILTYSISNSQQELYGAIDNDNNTITIYIPYYLGVDYLVPEIKIDEGATLLDSASNEINLDGGIEPVPVGNSSTYIVRSSDNITRTYTLIQKYLPFKETLLAGYTTSMIDTATVKRTTTQFLQVYGNFASTGSNAKFTFTDKITGTQYHNFVDVLSIAPSEAYYTMNAQITPEALAGKYTVQVQHQGRTAQLPDMELSYSLPFPTFFSSSANYAVGDTISFTPSYATYGNQGVYLELDRVYLKIGRGLSVPSTFTDDLYDKEIALQIVSQTRREVKAILPAIPVGNYTNISNNMLFYFDYADHTGFGKGVRTGVTSNSFLINPKKAD